ncbi:hypothetical protein AJ79_07481 [Helicocarpus griseus UAMH5409]|uniref:G-patch domain-containing protein n=1 Tax=Helicocarpus griseus UAMH5409 TaxID=1447875 RepID=A0A2B7WUA3_9EURO|nr:hypothetical protein AJ79_07481 [Helicocarpus griseus UAMH5409]
MAMTYDDDEYFLPLEDQRVFGAGIKRKRVPFIPASETTITNTTAAAANTPSSKDQSSGTATTLRSQSTPPSIGDRYLSIVLPSAPSTGTAETPATTSTSAPTSTTSTPPPSTATSTAPTCQICHLPVTSSTKPHATSLAHQLCLPHSHPPSAIDRTRPGYKYLSAQGWDPDSRLGLGSQGQGISVPLKPRVKHDTLGLGVRPPKRGEENAGKKKRVEKLNAKQVRKVEEEGKKKGERLREMFYWDGEVEKYLGAG